MGIFQWVMGSMIFHEESAQRVSAKFLITSLWVRWPIEITISLQKKPLYERPIRLVVSEKKK